MDSSAYHTGTAPAILKTEHHKEIPMIRRIVACPACDLRFLSARARTYCPGCHQLVEPRVA